MLRPALLSSLLFLLASSASAQPIRLLVEDLRPPESRNAVDVGADHPWIPDVMDLVGLREPGAPIRVLLVPESSTLSRDAPAWASGYAEVAADRVVLLPERAPSYPDGQLEDVLAHEVAHVMLFRVTGGHLVPRWFNEGVAMVAGRSWGIQDRTRAAFVLLSGGKIPLHRLDSLFRGDRTDVERAYALSGAMVQHLLVRFGAGLPRGILLRVARGETFDDSLRQLTGESVVDFQESFFSSRAAWGRWIPVLTSAAVLWLGITLLAVVAAARRRRRQREALARMAAEEAAHAGSESDLHVSGVPGPVPPET